MQSLPLHLAPQAPVKVSALGSIGVLLVSAWVSLRCLVTTTPVLAELQHSRPCKLQALGRTRSLLPAPISAHQPWQLAPALLATSVKQAVRGLLVLLTIVTLVRIVLQELLDQRPALQANISQTHCKRLASTVPKVSFVMGLRPQTSLRTSVLRAIIVQQELYRIHSTPVLPEPTTIILALLVCLNAH
jgi:hypothetical protein